MNNNKKPAGILKRIVCLSEKCNRSFYTYHVSEVEQCPYCGAFGIKDFDAKNGYHYYIECREF